VVEFFSRALRMSEINAARYAAVFCDCESEKIKKTVSLNRRGEGGSVRRLEDLGRYL